MHKLDTITSGGQTGADFFALVAAKNAGFKTSGYAPAGYRVEGGKNLELRDKYGLREAKSPNYAVRTELNVKLSDATIRFATNFSSPGEICTLNAIKKHNKPYLDINPDKPLSTSEVARWIKDNNIRVLNIAGNRESTSKGIGSFTERFLAAVFEKLPLLKD